MKFEILSKLWAETYAYWIYLECVACFDPYLTGLTYVWPLDDLIWPMIILNSNSWQNFESKHTYTGYISTTLPDLTLIRPFWPKFDLWWPDLTSNNLEFEFSTKFRVKTYVFWIYFDYLARFDPNLTVWPTVDLVWPLTGHDMYIFGINSSSRSNDV